MARAKREVSAGGVLFRCTPDGPRYLLILDAYRKWGFPKGHVDPGESAEEAARREVQEETGLRELVRHDYLGQIEWYFRLRGRLIHKFCDFYLFEAPSGEPVPQRAEGITSCRWYPAEAALATISYRNARGLLEQAVARVPELCARADAGGDR